MVRSAFINGEYYVKPNVPSKHPIKILSVYSCHLPFTQTCSMVLSPHSSMHDGTHATMPYLRPSAAPAGCSVTKKAKKRATAVLRSPFFIPISVVKCADSALPICCGVSKTSQT